MTWNHGFAHFFFINGGGESTAAEVISNYSHFTKKMSGFFRDVVLYLFLFFLPDSPIRASLRREEKPMSMFRTTS